MWNVSDISVPRLYTGNKIMNFCYLLSFIYRTIKTAACRSRENCRTSKTCADLIAKVGRRAQVLTVARHHPLFGLLVLEAWNFTEINNYNYDKYGWSRQKNTTGCFYRFSKSLNLFQTLNKKIIFKGMIVII